MKNIKPIYSAAVFEKKDAKADKKAGIREGSKRDIRVDAKANPVPKSQRQPKAVVRQATMRTIYKK